jgi:putative tricarboxylic transport membrane protein
MVRTTSRVLASIAIAGAGVLFVDAAHAQTFPSKPIELVVHTSPGGGADLFGRYVADLINREKLLPQPVVVVNKPGGAHAVAAKYVASKHGDPHTILTIAHSSFLSIPTVSGQDLGLDQFVPLALFAMDSHTVTVQADSPHKSVKDLLAAAKSSPKAITAGIGTIGGTAHMLGYLLEKQADVKLNYIGLKGGGEAVLGVLGGHYQVCFENVSEVIDHVKAKKLRILAVPTEKRLSFLPEVPTLKEQGYPLIVGLGRGFLAPKGIPDEARRMLEGVFEKAHRTEAWKEFASRNMFEDVFMQGEQFEQWLLQQRPGLVQFIREVGLAKKG